MLFSTIGIQSRSELSSILGVPEVHLIPINRQERHHLLDPRHLEFVVVFQSDLGNALFFRAVGGRVEATVVGAAVDLYEELFFAFSLSSTPRAHTNCSCDTRIQQNMKGKKQQSVPNRITNQTFKPELKI